MEIDLLSPNIFDKNRIIAGVSKANFNHFSEGFSIFPAQILSSERVEFFRNILAENLGVSRQDLVFQKQIHSDQIQKITEKTAEINESDGMITNIVGIVLNVTIADCVGVLVYDPINSAIGAFHSGWRGTALGITSKGIKLMHKEYGTNPKDLLVWLSPAASGENYEVGGDVADNFPNFTKTARGDKFLLDLRKYIKHQLIEIGVNADNIEKSDVCTISDKQYHSYRRDKDKSGRMSAFISMK